MPPDLIRRLRKLDGTGWESPPGFDYWEALREVFSKKEEIEKILGVQLDLDTNVQDASHLTDFRVLDSRYFDPVKRVGGIIEIIAVRFSRFDRMVTVFGTEIERWQDKLPALSEYLEKQGYNFISPDYLKEPYEGGRLGTEGWTWFSRFFDYL